jgi:hypothetical protein
MESKLIGFDVGSYKATIASIDRFSNKHAYTDTTIVLNEASNR